MVLVFVEEKIGQHNVFVACDFDMKFTYILAGWEGTKSNSRILKDVLIREDLLLILEGELESHLAKCM